MQDIRKNPLEIWLSIGQSQVGAGSGPSGPPPIIATPYPEHILYLRGLHSLYGSEDWTSYPSGIDGLAPFEERTTVGLLPLHMMAVARRAIDVMMDQETPVRALFASWEGSQPLESFFPGVDGHWNFENLIAGLAAIREKAGAPSELTLLHFIQGEAGPFLGYRAMLEEFIDTVPKLAAMHIGQQRVPHFLFRQINSHSTATAASGVELDQLAVARARLGMGVTMSGPMYQMPLHDVIHVDNIGRMMGGEIDALAAYYASSAGDVFHPLWPVAGGVVRSGKEIRIPMQLPPTTGALSFDIDWIKPVPDYGFHYVDDGSGAVINKVAIDGHHIAITLSADPGDASNKKIGYARFNGPDAAGWASGRGQLYTNSWVRSPFREMGFSVPRFIRHYCVRFEEDVP